MPDVARGVFAERLDLAVAFAALLTGDGATRGLIGPREPARIWERHLLNCAVLAEVVPAGAHVCDIGSGAGLPGLVLAIARPDLCVTLVEPLLRRTTFLGEVTDALGLDTVEVVRARAEEIHGKREFDVVTSRAVAPLPRLLAWSMPLVRRGGLLVAMKGAAAAEEVGDAGQELASWGVGRVDVLLLGAGVIDPPATVIRVESRRPSQLGWDSAQKSPTTGRRSSTRPRRKGRQT